MSLVHYSYTQQVIKVVQLHSANTHQQPRAGSKTLKIPKGKQAFLKRVSPRAIMHARRLPRWLVRVNFCIKTADLAINSGSVYPTISGAPYIQY
jgi:hypothetical protein